jgi:hypothetical protein
MAATCGFATSGDAVQALARAELEFTVGGRLGGAKDSSSK